MLRIRRTPNGQAVFTLSGRIGRDNLAELETLVRGETGESSVVLDLTDVTLVDQDAVAFLERCENGGTKLKNCPPYIREWIVRRRSES